MFFPTDPIAVKMRLRRMSVRYRPCLSFYSGVVFEVHLEGRWMQHDPLLQTWKNLFESSDPPRALEANALIGVWKIETTTQESRRLVFSETDYAFMTWCSGEPVSGESGRWKPAKAERNALKLMLQRSAVFPGKIQTPQGSVDRIFTEFVEAEFFSFAQGIFYANALMTRESGASATYIGEQLSELRNLMKAADSLLQTRAQGARQFASDSARLARQEHDSMQRYIESGVGRPKIF
jgi:hypothetical protein